MAYGGGGRGSFRNGRWITSEPQFFHEDINLPNEMEDTRVNQLIQIWKSCE